MFHQQQTQRVDLGWKSNHNNNRLSSSKKDIQPWDGDHDTFAKYRKDMFAILLQKNMSYLVHNDFQQAYFQDPNYINTIECYQQWGHTSLQINHDIGWFYGSILMTMKNEDASELITSGNNGVYAWYNLVDAYALEKKIIFEPRDIIMILKPF